MPGNDRGVQRCCSFNRIEARPKLFERRSADLCERFADTVPRGTAPGRRHRSHAVTKVYMQRAPTGRDRRERVEDRASRSTACCVRSGQAANTTDHCDLPPKRGTSTIQSLPYSIVQDSRVREDDGPTRRMTSAPFAVYLDRSSSVFSKYPCATSSVKVWPANRLDAARSSIGLFARSKSGPEQIEHDQETTSTRLTPKPCFAIESDAAASQSAARAREPSAEPADRRFHRISGVPSAKSQQRSHSTRDDRKIRWNHAVLITLANLDIGGSPTSLPVAAGLLTSACLPLGRCSVLGSGLGAGPHSRGYLTA